MTVTGKKKAATIGWSSKLWLSKCKLELIASKKMKGPKFLLIGQIWSFLKSQSCLIFLPGQDHISSSLFNCQYQ